MCHKVHVRKVTMIFVDHDQMGEEETKAVIENVSYPNHCMDPTVVEMESVEVDWSDDHPLNHRAGMHETFKDIAAEQGSSEWSW